MKTSIVLSVLALSLALLGCNRPKSSGSSTSTGASAQTPAGDASPTSPSTAGAAGEVIMMPNGIRLQDLVIGQGAEALTGKQIAVHYTGTYPDGREFDTSRRGGQPYAFILGAGKVIQGWDEGLVGMRVGGRRLLTVPAALAYGDRGHPAGIPPNATLLFDVELMEVK